MTTAASPATCARSWEVEAVRDGRLRGNDAESLRRHLKTCSACATEHARLENIGGDLRALPAPQLDALAGRRIRQRVLMDHNQRMLRQEAPRWRWRRPLALLAACAALSAGIVGSRHFSKTPAASVPSERPPTVEVLTDVNAHWRRESSPQGVRVVLEDGELRLKIQRWRATDRVLIVLPDGALEDLGTVLDVAVSGGQTQHVTVEQGSVILRLQDEASRTLAAGQSWHRTPVPVAAKDNALASPVTSASSTPDRSNARRRPRGEHAATQPPLAGRQNEAAHSEQQTPSASETQASRAEDEAYLRLVDLLRDGRVREAREAARDYLLRFPTGFRRLEVLNIATHSAP